MAFKRPQLVSIVVNASNITTQILPDIIEFEYDSVLRGSASSIQLTMRDSNVSYTPKLKLGDFIEVKLRYEGDLTEVNSGTMVIDFVETSSEPAIASYGATNFNYNLNIANFGVQSFSNTQLNTIVQNVATANSLTLVGTVGTHIVGTSTTPAGTRVQQTNGNTLALLESLAEDYGYHFNIKLGNLTFEKLSVLDAKTPNVTLSATDATKHRIRARTSGLYRTALAHYATNSTASTIDTTVPQNVNFDLKNEGFYFDFAAAVARSQGALAKTNRRRHVRYMDMSGGYLLAGDVVNLTNAGVNNGKYICDRVTHVFSGERGWTMTCELDKVF